MFPEIDSLDTFSSSIEGLGRETIIRAEREDHVIFDYAVHASATFSNECRLECRGIVFDRKTGRLLSRPYHKFFNIDEREDTLRSRLDLSQPHVVLEKLDGSMVHAFVHEGRTRLFTRLGESDQARAAASIVEPRSGLDRLIRALDEDGATPIFEYVAPDNQIVVTYDEPELVLTAVRERKTGLYRSMNDLVDLGRRFGVKVVRSLGHVEDIDLFIADLRKWQSVEGVVVRFDSGLHVKGKCDWYVGIHKIRYTVAAHEPTVLSHVLRGTLDDIMPYLAGTPDFERIRSLEVWFLDALRDMADRIEKKARPLIERAGSDRARFAKEVLPGLDKTDRQMLAPLVFEMLRGQSAYDAAYALVRRTIIRDESRNAIIGSQNWRDFKERVLVAGFR